MPTATSLPTSLANWRKPLMFALCAAAGTLAAAALGELWLLLLGAPAAPPPPQPPIRRPQTIELLLDTSGSMAGASLDQVKAAAMQFVQSDDLTQDSIGIVRFDSTVQVLAAPGHDKAVLNNVLANLTTGNLTRMDLGLATAQAQLQSAAAVAAPATATGAPATGAAAQQDILLFTDGVPTGSGDPFHDDTSAKTLDAANAVRSAGIRLVAIATGDADRDYLAQLTGSPDLVFWAADGHFGDAFKQAQQVISQPTYQMIASQPNDGGGQGLAVLRIGGWTGLLGLGLALALLLAQTRYTHASLTVAAWPAVAGGLAAGVAAGALGQGLYGALAGSGASGAGLLIAWALLGTVLGYGTAQFIPNLKPGRAALGGLLGGAAGAVGYLLASVIATDISGTAALGDVAGRWIGAAILGFGIGLMVVLAELSTRRAWLRVAYGPADAFDLTLGETPLLVGSDRAQCRVVAREALPVAGRYSIENGTIVFEDTHAHTRQIVSAGHSHAFTNVTVTVLGDVERPRPAGAGLTPAGGAPALYAGAAQPSAAAPQAALRQQAPGQAGVPQAGSAAGAGYLSPEQALTSTAPPLASGASRPAVPAPPLAAPPAPPLAAPAVAPAAPAVRSGATVPLGGVAPLPPAGAGWQLAHANAPLVLPARAGSYSVGRAADNDFVINDPNVSSRHARLQVGPATLTVTDCDSTNGTAVNGAPLTPQQPHELKAGDTVTMGLQSYRVARS